MRAHTLHMRVSARLHAPSLKLPPGGAGPHPGQSPPPQAHALHSMRSACVCLCTSSWLPRTTSDGAPLPLDHATFLGIRRRPKTRLPNGRHLAALPYLSPAPQHDMPWWCELFVKSPIHRALEHEKLPPGKGCVAISIRWKILSPDRCGESAHGWAQSVQQGLSQCNRGCNRGSVSATGPNLIMSDVAGLPSLGKREGTKV